MKLPEFLQRKSPVQKAFESLAQKYPKGGGERIGEIEIVRPISGNPFQENILVKFPNGEIARITKALNLRRGKFYAVTGADIVYSLGGDIIIPLNELDKTLKPFLKSK